MLGTVMVLFIASDHDSISTVRSTSRRASCASRSPLAFEASAFENFDGPVDQSFEARLLDE